MNAINLYVSTSRIILQHDPNFCDDKISELYRLVPFLRQSISCAVCGRLLKDPFSPKESKCQHNVCRLCVRGKKNIRPSCNFCKDCQDYRTYEENKQMRILIQCYKSLCEHIMSTALYSYICEQSVQTCIVSSGVIIPHLSLVELIEEGANFEDILMAFSTELQRPYVKPALLNSVPILTLPTTAPTVQTPQLPLVVKQEFPLVDISRAVPVNLPQNSPSQTLSFLKNPSAVISSTSTNASTIVNSPASIKLTQLNKTTNFCSHHRTEPKSAVIAAPTVETVMTQQVRNPPPIKTVSNGTAMYSVLYTGIGNKITIKRKTDLEEDTSRKAVAPTLFRQINKQNNKRRGCRCGNATATPGKLTCCGQRCPCYVDSKSCIGCKCRGCRNPHRPDGGKVRPVIPELACYEIHMADDNTSPSTSHVSVAKDVAPTNPLSPAPCFKTRKEYASSDFPVNTRITVTPIMSSIGTISQRSQTASSTTPQLQGAVKQQQTFTTTNKVQRERGLVQLENLSKESLLIQSPEGKYQVVNVFTSTSHQNQQAIKRIHSISHSSNNTFIVPKANQQISTSIHQIPEISTTLPQIIMQQQSQQHQMPPNNCSSFSSNTQLSTYPKHNNVITLHTMPTPHIPQSKNSTISLSSSPATFTLSPIIVTSPSSFPSDIFQDDEFLANARDSPLSMPHPPLLEVHESSEL